MNPSKTPQPHLEPGGGDKPWKIFQTVKPTATPKPFKQPQCGAVSIARYIYPNYTPGELGNEWTGNIHQFDFTVASGNIPASSVFVWTATNASNAVLGSGEGPQAEIITGNSDAPVLLSVFLRDGSGAMIDGPAAYIQSNQY